MSTSQGAGRSCRQHLIQLVEQLGQLGAEELVGLAEAALLDEGRELEVGGVDGEAGGDVVADEVEPGELLGGEGAAAGGLLGEPGGVARVDGVGAGDERVLLVEGDADEGDEVGEDALGAGAATGVVALATVRPSFS